MGLNTRKLCEKRSTRIVDAYEYEGNYLDNSKDKDNPVDEDTLIPYIEVDVDNFHMSIDREADNLGCDIVMSRISNQILI